MISVAFSSIAIWTKWQKNAQNRHKSLFAGLLALLMPLSALSGLNAWTGAGPLIDAGPGNYFINAMAVSSDGKIVYAGSRTGRVFSYEYPDSVPTAFSFVDQTGVPLSTVVESSSITVSGINIAATIAVTGGFYEIDGNGAWRTDAGTVSSGALVKVRHTTSGNYSTTTNTTLNIGGVTDTFSTTTVGAPSPGACASVAGPLSSAPSTGLCTAGTASIVTNGLTEYTWTCLGLNGGSPSVQCSVPRRYLVTPSAGSNGSISPNTGQLVAYNNMSTFTVTASQGYIASVAGTCSGSLVGGSYTTSAITNNCTVVASFIATGTPVCTLATNLPNPIRPRQSTTLTASCTPAATSYTWTGLGCAGNTSASCTVNPATTTTYSVTGANGPLTSTASATVTVKAADLTPILMLLLD